MLKICKFGGSSLANSTQFKKVRKIIESDETRKVIVVSAPGKGENEPIKITDLLFACYEKRKIDSELNKLFAQVEDRYLTIQKELGITSTVAEDLANIKEALKEDKIGEAELVSRGEFLSAKLLSAYLGYEFLDSKNLVRFGFDGKIDHELTRNNIIEAFKKVERVVVPGFYGSYPNGDVCLFSRGGSDVTGSYFAEALNADLYENFTDVSGFYMSDPRLIPNPHKINQISYEELRELSYAGAQVLHEETILPLVEKSIPLIVLNSNAPEESGTIIKENAIGHHLITGLAGKKGFMAITFVKTYYSDKLETIRQVLNIFSRYQVPVEHIPTSIDSFSIIVEENKISDRLDAVMKELVKIPEIVSISEDHDVALITIVGKNMAKKSGVSGRLLSTFGDEKINIKLIDQGREEINIIVGISNDDFERSIKALYSRFAKELV